MVPAGAFDDADGAGAGGRRPRPGKVVGAAPPPTILPRTSAPTTAIRLSCSVCCLSAIARLPTCLGVTCRYKHAICQWGARRRHRLGDPSVPFESPRPLESVEQRWFVGSHGNVGGGSYNDLLSQLPLRWLMSKAEKHGLAFRQSLDIDEKAAAGEIDDSFKAFLKGAYSLLHAEQRYWRPIGRPPEARTHTVVHTINETIDASVFERWRMAASTVRGTWPIGQKSTRSRLRTSPGHA